MKIPSEIKGVVYAFGASLTLAISLAVSKSLLGQISIFKLGFIWFSISSVFNLLIYSLRSKGKRIFDHQSNVWLTAIIVAVIDAIASFLFFLAIQKMENPAVVSFIGNLGPVLVTIAGIVLLRERFRAIQVTGIVLTLAGVFVLSFSKGRLFQPGSEFVLIAAVLFSASTIIARSRRDSVHTELLSTVRSLILFSFCAVWFGIKGETLYAEPFIWKQIATGALLESVLTVLLNYEALKFIEATRTSLILSSKALWLLIIAYAFLGVIPPFYHIISGILTIVGLVFITRQERRTKVAGT